ncbi:hypothetical protein GCM10018793_46180 [Streptomyces sulfonofaciens]|uniref:DUF4232 domain-containing protein n=1 Tax=Streptomyces sulfonofaciens TaxID=68272 RepID=A0A919L4F7_9ACTN|nr:DUF4232 domain-containing protein [Streptomyces sulfonofaciens]GHH83623.1 hypothetical protein GCM10018793_46180 [Streptomyces sulfonofaciens]
MFPRTARRGLPAVALVAVGLALTACGPDGSSSSSSSSPASSSDGSSGGSSSGSSGGSSAAAGGSDSANGKAGGSAVSGASGAQNTSAASKSVPACATSKLKTTAENFSAGAGHTTFQIVFQNIGTASCTLSGYPGVSFVKAHNVQLGKAASRTSTPSGPVTLIPNAHAYADVRTVDGPGGYTDEECDLTTVPTLRVYPPNQKESANIPWNKQECVGSGIQNLMVGPVHGNK